EVVEKANMTKFIEYVNQREELGLDPFNHKAYFQLYDWSVNYIEAFWHDVWDFVEIKASQKFSKVVDDLSKFPGASWFVGAKLNFAENLLRRRDGKTALVAVREDGFFKKLTYLDLHREAGAVAEFLREVGVGVGDRVCGYLPNTAEACAGMLGTTALGASWSSTGTEIGVEAAVDRFGQLNPKAILTVDGYVYRGKTFNVLERVERIVRNIPSIEAVIVVPYVDENPAIKEMDNAVLYTDLGKHDLVKYEQVPSSTPVYIMFSSGTTGKPKSMVQSTAGVLINHLKELIIHSDLKPEDTITYITSPSWMMWNWLMSSLAVGATLLLYDGDPNYPDWRTMWKIIDQFEVSVFGCSASYINHLRSLSVSPRSSFDLSSLREISQTGSPLSADGFKWVYEEVKKDHHFNSISGGTDINGCFAIGSPILPVYAGQLQSPGLGMKVKCYDEEANPIYDREGELVCEAPAPSMPLYFLNDPDNAKYLETYFSFYTKKRVWRHGDYVVFHSDTGGITFLGRSDAVLKPSGVRIGTAEIYSIVEQFKEVADSLVVRQTGRGAQRPVLFVKMAEGYKLTEELKERIKKQLREKASPRHVPAVIMETPDIPYTFNMKKVEVAVSNIINGRKVVNRDAIRNPESLDFFEKVLPMLERM
ncbi:MAG: acetoacetate--CoA ligase, partial [Candidatus Caldarchaeum sp.]|nr:acetoacetate--CoA ligase [Candidatus Caldarchaeum sp.]